MQIAKQAGFAPTRKLATMLVGTPALYSLVGPAVEEFWPQVAPAALTGPAFTAFISAAAAAAIAGIAAYFVPDAPNVAPKPEPAPDMPRLKFTADEIRQRRADQLAEDTLPLRDCDKILQNIPLGPKPAKPRLNAVSIRDSAGNLKLDPEAPKGAFK